MVIELEANVRVFPSRRRPITKQTGAAGARLDNSFYGSSVFGGPPQQKTLVAPGLHIVEHRISRGYLSLRTRNKQRNASYAKP